jgi:hypothetical protein
MILLEIVVLDCRQLIWELLDKFNVYRYAIAHGRIFPVRKGEFQQ